MIREASVLDKERIIELGFLLNDNFDKIYDINEMLNDSISKIYLYEKEEKIVGFLSATVLEDTTDILSIVVDPKYRHQGIGSNLLDYFISDLDSKIRIITLEVRTTNKEAIGLYEKFGFEIVNTRKKYYHNGDDAYLMGRVIKE